jgi:hypothetical protein
LTNRRLASGSGLRISGSQAAWARACANQTDADRDPRGQDPVSFFRLCGNVGRRARIVRQGHDLALLRFGFEGEGGLALAVG